MAAVAEDTLRVGTSGDYPPFSEQPPSGPPPAAKGDHLGAAAQHHVGTDFEPRGFDIDVARRFASDTGRRLTFVRFAWSELTDDLHKARFDIAMGGVTGRPERALHGMFSRPYVVTGAVVVVRANDTRASQQLDWLDSPTVRMAVNRGGHLEKVARERFPRAALTAVGDNLLLPQMLLSREIDAAVAERFEAKAWEKAGLSATPPFTRDRKVYLIRSEKAALVAELDTWLAAREADGWLDQLRRRWFQGADRMSAAEACVEAVRSRLETRMALMPYVVGAKRQRGLGVEDRSQEAKVLRRARELAQLHSLPVDEVASLFRSLIDAAKLIQTRAALHGATPGGTSLDALRRAVAVESEELVAEMARCRGMLTTLPGSKAMADADIPTHVRARILNSIVKASRVP